METLESINSLVAKNKKFQYETATISESEISDKERVIIIFV